MSNLAVNASQLKLVTSSGSTLNYIPYFEFYNGSNYTNRSYLTIKIPTSAGALTFYKYKHNVFAANQDIEGYEATETWTKDGYRYYKFLLSLQSSYANLIIVGNTSQITEITREKRLWDNYSPFIFSATADEW